MCKNWYVISLTLCVIMGVQLVFLLLMFEHSEHTKMTFRFNLTQLILMTAHTMTQIETGTTN